MNDDKAIKTSPTAICYALINHPQYIARVRIKNVGTTVTDET